MTTISGGGNDSWRRSERVTWRIDVGAHYSDNHSDGDEVDGENQCDRQRCNRSVSRHRHVCNDGLFPTGGGESLAWKLVIRPDGRRRDGN